MLELRMHGGQSRAGPWGRRAVGALALACVALAANASSSASRFGVSVTLFPPFKDTAECGQAGSPGNVVVSCITPGSAVSPRFLLQLYRDGAQVGTVDGETSPGTLLSWKVMHIADRDFLEIMVGW